MKLRGKIKKNEKGWGLLGLLEAADVGEKMESFKSIEENGKGPLPPWETQLTLGALSKQQLCEPFSP